MKPKFYSYRLAFFICLSLLFLWGCKEKSSFQGGTASKSSEASEANSDDNESTKSKKDKAKDKDKNSDLDADAKTAKRSCKKFMSVAIVLDTSGSMNFQEGQTDPLTPAPLNPDGSPARVKMDIVKDSAARFIDKLHSQDYVGIAQFSDIASELSPLMKDKDLVKEGLDRIAPFGSTDLVAGLQIGADLLEQTPKNKGYQKILVLLSDGNHTVLETDPLATAEKLKSDDPKLKIITVGYELNPEGKENMKKIASSESSYIDAPNSEAVINKFRKLGEKICDAVK